MFSAPAAGISSLVDQPRHHRAAGRVVDRVEARLHRDAAVEHPHRRVAAEGLHRQRDRDRPQPGARHQGQRAPVHRVGDRAAVQAERDQRHQREDADQADVERRVGQRVDLDRDRDVGHLLAELGDGVAEEQPAVRRRDLQRPDVGDHRPPPATGGRASRLGLGVHDANSRTRAKCLVRSRGPDVPLSDTGKEVVRKCILYGFVRWLLASSAPASHADEQCALVIPSSHPARGRSGHIRPERRPLLEEPHRPRAVPCPQVAASAPTASSSAGALNCAS